MTEYQPRRGWIDAILEQEPRFLRYEYAAGSLGFILGILLVNFDQLLQLPDRDTVQIVKAERPQIAGYFTAPHFQTWIILIGVQFAFWLGVAPYLLKYLRDLKQWYRGGYTLQFRVKMILAILLFGLPVLLMLMVFPSRPGLPMLRAKVVVVNVISVAVVCVTLSGLWLIRAIVETTPWNDGSSVEPGQIESSKVVLYLLLRKRIQSFILVLGAILSLGTVARAALRHALLKEGVSRDQFPPETILMFGAYFTTLLALAYVPTYQRLLQVGELLSDRLAAPVGPTLDQAALDAWNSKQKCCDELLQLNTNVVENVRTQVSIMGPAVTSALSLLMTK